MSNANPRIIQAISNFQPPQKPNSRPIVVDPSNGAYIPHNPPYPKDYDPALAGVPEDTKYNIGVYETYAKVAIYMRQNGVDWQPPTWDYSDVAEMEEAVEGFSMPAEWNKVAEKLTPSSDSFRLGVRDALASIVLAATGGTPRTPRTDTVAEPKRTPAHVDNALDETTTAADTTTSPAVKLPVDSSIPSLFVRLGTDKQFAIEAGVPPAALSSIRLSLPQSVLDAVALLKLLYKGARIETVIDVETPKMEIRAWLPQSS